MSRRRKAILALFTLLAILAAAGGVVVHRRGFDRIAMGLTLFRGVAQGENFRRAYEIFPVAALIGTLFAIAQLVGTSEYTVMRVSGASLFQIGWVLRFKDPSAMAMPAY